VKLDDTYGDIPLLACNPEYKNLSVNWRLLHSAIEWFSSKGISRVESSTHETNKACQAMFEIAGMHISGKSHDYHIWVQQYQF
jgi:RimJ/RimL family protein N-acetyltransferase